MRAAAATCLAYYEELRGRVLAGRAAGSRLGLSLLLRSGMVAWMEGWAACSLGESAAQAGEVARRVEPLPDECGADLVSLLANMALFHLREASA
ncbi:MAG TPA: hypothetical protein VKM54_06615 [Myxococcota bacterium]|nr:hypothetical protein [Myxococcota bacterium]